MLSTLSSRYAVKISTDSSITYLSFVSLQSVTDLLESNLNNSCKIEISML